MRTVFVMLVAGLLLGSATVTYGVTGHNVAVPTDSYFFTYLKSSLDGEVPLDGNYGLSDDPTVDATVPLQAALTAATDAGKCLLLGKRTYIVRATILIASTAPKQGPCLRGRGEYSTFIDSQVANAPTFRFDGGNNASFLFGTRVFDLTVMTTTTPPNNDGFFITANWRIRIENVRVIKLSGDQVRFTGSNDEGSNQWVTIHNVFFQGGTVGLDLTTNGTVGPNGYVDVTNIQIMDASGPCMRIRATAIVKVHNGGFFHCDNGVQIDPVAFNSGVAASTYIGHSQFQGNTNAHIQINSAILVELDQNEYYSDDAWIHGEWRPLKGVEIAPVAGQQVRTVHDKQAHHRIISFYGTPVTFTAYKIGADASYVTIENPDYVAGVPMGATKYDDHGVNTRIIEFNESVLPPALKASHPGSIPIGTFAPDLTLGQYIVLSYSTAGDGIIAAPTGYDTSKYGLEFVLSIYNSAGTTSTVTFDPTAYINAPKLAIPSGRWRIVRFISYPGVGWLAEAPPSRPSTAYFGNRGDPGMGAISGATPATFTIPVVGAVAGCVPSAYPSATLAASYNYFTWTAYVSAADTVLVAVYNLDAATPHTPTAQAWYAAVHCP